VRAPEVLAAGEAAEVEVSVPRDVPGHDELALALSVDDGPERSLRNRGDGRYTAPLTGFAPGAHRLKVGARHAPEASVTALTLVMEHEGEEGTRGE
jgi:hypothetical protein